MNFDFAKLPANLCYKLLVSLVVPRPIALVSTLSPEGVVNAAPFSFFNLMGDDPPIVIVSVENRPDGRPKDTARNIVETGEFVVNLVDEATASRMHACSADFPPEVSEPEQVGFTTIASEAIKAPRIAESPVSLECRLLQKVPVSEKRLLAIGQVLWLHCHEGLVDPKTLRVNMDQYFPVGRLYADQYVKTRDRFAVTESPEYVEQVRKLGRL